MGRQIIFCVETDKRARTDVIYIKETINKFFSPVPDDYNIQFICMGGKSKYKSKEVLKEIKEKTKMFLSNGETIVIYCIDTDKIESSNEHLKEYEEIARFCMQNNYKFVWFCHDVEEVYLGHSIDDGKKKDAAVEFKVKNRIKEVDKRNLLAKQPSKSKSNILEVLEESFKEQLWRREIQ